MNNSLRQYLIGRGMTQRRAAKLLGIRFEYLNRLVRGKTPITTEFIGRFAVTFGWQDAQEVFAGFVPDRATRAGGGAT